MFLFFFFLFTFSLAKERFSVKLSNTSAESFALEHNLKHIKRVLDYDIFEADNLHLLITSESIHHDTKRKLYKRYYTRYSDPLYPSQWHLKTIGETNEYTGRGVVIGIVDDGIQHTHPDLHDNYLASSSWDYNDNDPDPMPYREDGHGTSAAGVAAAVQNNICGRGVAFKARLAGIRLLGGNVYDYEEAQALTHDLTGKINIYSNSWGPQDDGMRLEKPGPVTEAGLKRGYEKGKIYVWAGGNGRQALDRSDYDGYASSRYVIAIGAVDHLGQQAYYSEPGACLFAVAPSSGGQKGITTTDLMGSYGYSQTECTNNFGGTSSAAPLAAGIFAVLLELNPRFTMRDIQHLIYKTRTENSHEMGFGVLNLPRLIVEAKRHVSPPGAKEYWTEKSKNGKFVIPTKMEFIERVMLVASITHGRRGQLGISMTSPSGQKSVFSELHNDLHRGSFTWTYHTVRSFGEKNEAGQTWEVKVEDLVPGDNYVGNVDSLQLGFVYF